MLRSKVSLVQFGLSKCSRLSLNQGLVLNQAHPRPLLRCQLSKSELKACYRLFHRSGFIDPGLVPGSQLKRFWVNSRSGIPRISSSSFHTSASSSNSQNQKPEEDQEQNEDEKYKKKGEKNDAEKERALFMFKALVGFTMLPIIIHLLFSDPRSDQRADPSAPEFVQPHQSLQNSPTQRNQQQKNIQDVTWTDFYYNMLLAGEVEEIIVHTGINAALVVLRPDAMYKGQRVANNRFRMVLQNPDDLENRIREAEAKLGIPPENGISIKYERRSENIGRLVGIALLVGLLGLLFMGGRNLRATISSNNPFTKLTKAEFTLVDPQIRTGKGVKFADVAGLKEAKIEVKEFVDYLKSPEKYRELGARPPKGALLTGPPGCGKTMLAKAVANESNVPFLSMNGSEFMEMIGGLGAARVRNLFAEARKRSPSIIYIDEIDAIGRKRSGGMSAGGGGGVGEAEQTLNQLLVEMDGISSTAGVIMLASTNRADVLDRALLRPGRFDRHIMIDLPNVIERKEILEQHMKGVKLEADATKYSERLATLTPGFSGADLANVVNEAALHAARIKYDKVKGDNFEYAIERVIAGPEKKSNVLSPNEKKVVAYHESGHALVGWMLKHTDALLKVTILPRTSQALGFAQYTPVDKKLYSPDELMDRMCMALGGRVAEAITFNKVTTGAQNDLEKVTKMAYAQIKFFGFNDKVGLLAFEEQSGGVKPYSKTLQATMDHEARLLIAEAYRKTEECLNAHKEQLKVMAEALLAKETLNYDDVEKLLGAPPHGKKHLVSPVDFEKDLNEQSKLGAEVNGGVTSG